MLRFVTLLSLLSLVFAKECGVRTGTFYEKSDRIVGGKPAERNQFPWQVSWRYVNQTTGAHRHICGASVIDDSWLITAAHCVDLEQNGQTDPKLFKAGFGMHLQNEAVESNFIDIDSIIMHPGWDSKTLANDIAMIKLTKPIGIASNPNVNAICIGRLEHDTEGKDAIISGWGLTENGGSSIPNELQMADVKVEKLKSCRSRYSIIVPILDSHVCAGYNPGVCNGDSGGPLQYKLNGKYYLLGATSFGAGGCGSTIFPGVFTRCPYYIDWIQKTTGLTLP